MKAKIIAIGIVLIGMVAACGVNDSDSHKFDSSKVNGTWKYTTNRTVRVDPKNFNGFDHIRIGTANAIHIEYPYIHACVQGPFTSSGGPLDKKKFGFIHAKEDIKINHTKGNHFKVLKINGDHVNGIALKIKKDTMGWYGWAPLVITKIKNEKEKKQFVTGLSIEPAAIFKHTKNCRNNAVDSSGVLF